MARYGFLQIPTGNCEAPETRNQNVFAKGNGASNVPTKKRLLTRRSKRDILLQPRNTDEEKLTAKELERTKKWRDMAVSEKPTNGSLHYSFPITKKVTLPFRKMGIDI